LTAEDPGFRRDDDIGKAMDIFDFIFDGFQAFNFIGFSIGGLVMAGIGALLMGDTIIWLVRSKRVKARVVAVKSTGTRRSDKEWEEEYAGLIAANPEPDMASFKQELKKKPVSFVPSFIVIFLLILVPVVFMSFGVYMVSEYITLKSDGIRVTATIVDVERREDSDGADTYAPVLEFTDRSENVHRYGDRVSTGSSSYQIGAKKTVYYDPKKPSRFIMDSFWRYAGFGLIFFGIGLAVFIFLFGGLFMKLAGVKKKRSEDEAFKKAVQKIKRQNLQNQHYIAVYEFAGPDGQAVQMEGSDANNWLADKLPGSEVTLLVRPDMPDEVRRPGLAMIFFGMVFVGPGLFMIHLAVSQFTFSIGSVAVILAALGFGAWKLKGVILPRSAWKSKEEFKSLKAQKKAEKKKKKSQSGYVLTAAEIAARMQILDRQALFTIPVVLLFAIGITAGGFQLHRDMQVFAERGVKAQGEIVALDSRRDSNGGLMYYARVEFRTEEGSVRFDDKVGSSSPVFRTGEQVKVIYDSGNPSNAIIDRGSLNWLGPAALLTLGLIMAWWSVKMLAGVVYRVWRD